MPRRFSMLQLSEDISKDNFKEIISLGIEMLSWSQTTDLVKNHDKISLMEEKFANWHLKFFQGGQSAIFALKFQRKNDSVPLILKAYTRFTPVHIASHVVSAKMFVRDFKDGIKFDNKCIYVHPAKNLLIAYSEFLKGVFLIQNFSLGDKLPLSVNMGKIARHLAAKGFIFDYYPNNWRLLPSTDPNILHIEYIDTVSSNNLVEIQELVKKISESLKSFEYESIL